MLTGSHERSYAVHIEDVAQQVANVPSIIKAPDGLDAHRHWRMYDMLQPIVSHEPQGSWLTIGDTGADAHALQTMGAQRIVASSIDDVQIRHIRSMGYLNGVEIRAINAEAIPPLDPKPDYLLCKEAYHHFPRPGVALYQFFETASKAVILIEPTDLGRTFPLDAGKRLAKTALRGDTSSHYLFEETGNFIFRLSLRELEKVLTALQAKNFFYRFFNDFYHPRVGSYPKSNTSARMAQRTAIAAQDVASRLRLMAWGLTAVVVPTGGISGPVQDALRHAGFTEKRLPRNPFG